MKQTQRDGLKRKLGQYFRDVGSIISCKLFNFINRKGDPKVSNCTQTALLQVIMSSLQAIILLSLDEVVDEQFIALDLNG